MNVEAVVFDYGGVIELPKIHAPSEIAKLLGITREEFMAEYFKNNHLANVGELSWEDVMMLTSKIFNPDEQTLLEIKGVLDRDAVEREINTELLDLIRNLKQKGYKTGILSNYSSELTARLESQGIRELFDVIVVSGDVGYQKPSVEIFHILLNELKTTAERVIFIDDSKKSLSTSEIVVYHPILFKNNAQFIADLSALLNI